jgi:hypothetical protein
MLFFCNKDREHWIDFALYPKKRLICVIHSYGNSATMSYAMFIFRWLYNEMHFNWQEDAKKMFLPYEPCGGWTYHVDPKCKKQRDGHQCGVWTLANASCLMIGINMDMLTEAVVIYVSSSSSVSGGGGGSFKRLTEDAFGAEVVKDPVDAAVWAALAAGVSFFLEVGGRLLLARCLAIPGGGVIVGRYQNYD